MSIRINTTKINNNHWTTQWIPISYNIILTKYQLNKSLTFTWTNKYILYAICRAYYINNYEIEIGDLWLNDEMRGKKLNNIKISYIFLNKVINKIWKLYPKCKNINLIVDKNNIPAIKLYTKLNFNIIKSIVSNRLNIKSGYYMTLTKT
jgi:hypothetical protein